jgi:hypothetical protein
MAGVVLWLAAAQAETTPPPYPDQFNIGAEVCLVLNKPAGGEVDLDRLRRGIAQVFRVFEGHMHDVRVAAEGCHYVFDGCTSQGFDDLNGSSPAGTRIDYFPPGNRSRWAEATLLSEGDVLTARASVLTLGRYPGWPLAQTCDDSERNVCSEYFNGSVCKFDHIVHPPGTTDEYLRRGIREQECHACPFKATDVVGADSYYPPWGVAPRRVRELRNATGVEVVWATIDMDLNRDWTGGIVALYLAWMSPALLSAAFALGWLGLCSLRPRHDPISHEVRQALHRVERQELLGRWQPRWGRRVGMVVWQARLLVVVGVCLLPWLPGQLILLAVLPAATSRAKVSPWMVPENLRTLRSTLLASALASVTFGCWILASAAGSYPSIPMLWWQLGSDAGGIAGQSIDDLLLDCPVVLGVATPGCFSFLLGLRMATIFFFQGVLCLAAVLMLALLLLTGPGIPFLCRRHSLHALLHPRVAPDLEATRFGRGVLIAGQPKEAATGIYGFIGCAEQELRAAMAGGVSAIATEVAALGDEVLSECFHYVVHQPAGASTISFQNGWLRDRAPDGSQLPTRDGMRLADFCALPVAQTAQLAEAHVVALRLYTTAAFLAINQPMRNLKTVVGEQGDEVPVEPPQLARPHPLPVTVAFIYEGLKRMRAVSASPQHNAPRRTAELPPDVWSTVNTVRAFFGLAAGGDRPAGPPDDHAAEAPSAGAGPARCTVPGAAPALLSVEPDGAPPGAVATVTISVGGAEAERYGRGELSPTGSGHDASGASRASSAPSCAADGRLSPLGPLPTALLSSRYLQAGRAVVRSVCERNPSQSAGSERARDVILWRGMRDLSTTPAFLARGGTELAPMSTTTDIHVAVQYARAGRGGESLLFRLRSSTFMNLGCDLTPFSAFPHEREALYPPLTYLQPTGKPHRLRYGGCTFTVLEMEPSFPS